MSSQNTNISRVIQHWQGWKFAKSGNHAEIYPLIYFCRIHIPFPVAWSYHAQFLALTYLILSSKANHIKCIKLSRHPDFIVGLSIVMWLLTKAWQLQSPKLRTSKLTVESSSAEFTLFPRSPDSLKLHIFLVFFTNST